MRHRLPRALALALVAAALLVPTGQAALQGQPAPSGEYIPFVTDFPKTESPRPDAVSAANELDWGSLSIAGGVGAALGALLASRLVIARRARPAPC